MATLEVLVHPHPHLKKPTQPVKEFNETLLKNYADMVETMYAHNGAGLAANQVGFDYRLFIANPTNEKMAICFANIEILEREGEEPKEEGCLSFPGLYVSVNRSKRVYAKACDEHGKPFEGWFDGRLAHIIQHETDHLDGIVFLDHFSPLKREILEKKYNKINRLAL